MLSLLWLRLFNGRGYEWSHINYLKTIVYLSAGDEKCCDLVYRYVFCSRIGKCHISRWYKSSRLHCLQISGYLWIFTGWNVAFKKQPHPTFSPLPYHSKICLPSQQLQIWQFPHGSFCLVQYSSGLIHIRCFPHSWYDTDGRKWDSVWFW